MINRVALLDVVGLSRNLIGEHTPTLSAFAQRVGGAQTMRVPLPALTTTVQTSMLTGAPVSEHGIVGNGWYDRAEGEVKFWKQSNHLVEAEPVWRTARRMDSSFTCANICWWYAMNADVDAFVTPRPIYRANGRKVPDCLTKPGSLRDELQAKHGQFPLFQFWGPGANIQSTRWIVDAALDVEEQLKPSLQLVYLPHLDYGLQKLGPNHPDIPKHLRELDTEIARLLQRFDQEGVRVVLVSEYGIEPVSRGIALNRVLRQAGHLVLREELGREILVPSESAAFVVADHQVAHVYVASEHQREEIAELLRQVDGVAEVSTPANYGLNHPRSGDLIAISESDAWFTYDWWLDPERAPDYARTVDIHRKPGYDPRELFMTSKVRAAWKLMLMRLGIRTLLDVIPLDDQLVRGSHGRIQPAEGFEPIILADGLSSEIQTGPMPCEQVRDLVLRMLFDPAH